MSSEPEAPPPSLRNVKSPFAKIIATHYYDGPTEGFLEHRVWGEACVFRLLDWDRETDLRVYEIARVTDTRFESIVDELFQDRLPSWPVWVLPSSSRSQAEALVDSCFLRARPLATITTRDLFEEIKVWDPPASSPISSGIVAPRGSRDSDTG